MQQIVWEGDTAHGHFQVIDAPYDGRPARVLYSGDRQAAQSGIARDNNPDLLFDYSQRLLELAIGAKPKTILMIGGGVGTLAQALLVALPEVHVDMVEPDEGLTKLAYDFFDLPVDDRLRLFHTDGRTFLREYSTRYDMVIVDAFTHTAIPKDLKTIGAFQAYRKHLRPAGMVAMNVISGYYGPGAHILQRVYAAALFVFDSVDLFLASPDYSLWLPQNFVLTARNASGASPADYLHAKQMPPPETSQGITLHDGNA